MAKQPGLTSFGKNMNILSNPNFQPEGTTRFNLNVVNESDMGDVLLLSPEKSNFLVTRISEGYNFLHDVNIGSGKLAIFSCDNYGNSEIGIFDEFAQTYEPVINDSDSQPKEKLNLSTEYPIDSTFKLRRGCERNVYFTDYNSPPREVNLDKPELYKNLAGRVIASKFRLQRLVEKVPSFTSISVLDYGGSLKSGSYNVGIHYVDANFNSTEFVVTSDIIIIYNDDSTKNFVDIKGSIALVQEEDFLNFPVTTKAIEVILNNLDTNFPYYRLALIEASTGSGRISSIQTTDLISTEKKDYVLTGLNSKNKVAEADILQVTDVIEKARHIEQVDNTLILGDIQGSQINFCELQKYASKVKADLVVKKVLLNSMEDPNNPKDPTVSFGGAGYMPGEIYPFGLVFVFEGNIESPVLHIPGKPPEISISSVFSPEDRTYGMSNDNACTSTLYLESNDCLNFWGKDSEGVNLTQRRVRHHRFPLRSQVGIHLVTEEGTNSIETKFFYLNFKAVGTVEKPVICEEGDVGCVPLVRPMFYARVVYTVEGEQFSVVISVNPTEISNPVSISLKSQRHLSDDFTIVGIYEDPNDGNDEVQITTGATSPKGLVYTTEAEELVADQDTKLYSGNIFGIKFSGIELPPESLTGKKCLGYYIVRGERTDAEKTILDSAVLTPMVKNSKYIAQGLLTPEFVGFQTEIDKDNYGLINLEHKFNKKGVKGFTEIIHEGNYIISKIRRSKLRFIDVQDGSGYDLEGHDKAEKDEDGFDIAIAVRDTEVYYSPLLTPRIYQKPQVEDLFYLDALESRDIEQGAKTIYNIAGDNKTGVIRFTPNAFQRTGLIINYPYLVFKRANLNPYSNFRSLEYFKEGNNILTAETTSVFSGDTYISPLRYTNTVFWENRIAQRKGKSGLWKKILGGLVILTGVLLAVFSGGLSLGLIGIGAGLIVAGSGALMLSSGVKKDNWSKTYMEEYEKGLRETALDSFVKKEFRTRDGKSIGPGDDEIQWISDTITDFWFESTVNANLRTGTTTGLPTHLSAPGIRESGNTTIEPVTLIRNTWRVNSDSRYPMSAVEFHATAKLLYFDPDRKDSRAYYGHPLGEYYKVNPDYYRTNKQKIFFGLGIEYDCCSNCREVFTQRFRYSLQSFQEEVVDNFKVFLPNNYKDIPGEYGEITNIFNIGSNLYIHTAEALYLMPRNYQERVTDQVISFIGAGSLFELPPQLILDAQRNSGGTTHKFACVKTPFGFFFVSETERAIYLFNGQNLEKISDQDYKPFFDKNLRIIGDGDENSKELIGLHSYPNNPLDNQGVGYSLGYDPNLKRVLITKIDRNYSTNVNYGFTISYDLKTKGFMSFHSYMPHKYLNTGTTLSCFHKDFPQDIFFFNKKGSHRTFFGTTYPTIIEYVAQANPVNSVVTNSVMINASFFRFNTEDQEYTEVFDTFFDKAILYNSEQCSGELKLSIKSRESEDFFANAVRNANVQEATCERTEGNWHLNEFRDKRVNYSEPMFIKKLSKLQANYFIDKRINPTAIDPNKDWSELGVFRDKYLIVRLIFDKFADKLFVLNLTMSEETPSIK